MFLDFMSLVLGSVGLWLKTAWGNATSAEVNYQYEQSKNKLDACREKYNPDLEMTYRIRQFIRADKDLKKIKSEFRDDFAYIYGEKWEDIIDSTWVDYETFPCDYDSMLYWIEKLILASYGKFFGVTFGMIPSEIPYQKRYITRIQQHLNKFGSEMIVLGSLYEEVLKNARYEDRGLHGLTVDFEIFCKHMGYQYVAPWW